MQISNGWLGRWGDKVWSLVMRHETKPKPVGIESVSQGPLLPSFVQPVIAPCPVDAPFTDKPSPVASEAVQTEVSTPKTKASRRLAAQIASQSRLNVRVGKKPRIARNVQAKSAVQRPVKVAAKVGNKAGRFCKSGKSSSSTIRSDFLPARHRVAKARPAQRSNVIPLSVTVKIGQPTDNAATMKLPRLAA